jgi:hypothetical protein
VIGSRWIGELYACAWREKFEHDSNGDRRNSSPKSLILPIAWHELQMANKNES